MPNFGVQEQPRRPGTTLTDVVPVQVEWEDGYLLPPTRPGLGIEFDREAARRVAVPDDGADPPQAPRRLVHQLVGVAELKVTALETIQLGEFSNLVWVRVHTDEGLVGLGETFFGAQAVAAYIHETAAPYLLGKDPLQIDLHLAGCTGIVGFNSTGDGGAGQLGHRPGAVGSVRQGDGSAGIPAARRREP